MREVADYRVCELWSVIKVRWLAINGVITISFISNLTLNDASFNNILLNSLEGLDSMG